MAERKSGVAAVECREDPVRFCEEYLGGETAWSKQREILEALRDHSRVAVRSGHGVGKTWTAARAALWFLYSHPGSIVLTTAPTQRQVRSILWSEIRRQVREARRPLGGRMTETSLFLREGWFALGLATDEAERFQGFHAEHVLLVCDEAPGVPEEIYEAARGVLTSQHSRALLIGNPTTPSGTFYEAFRRPGWHTVHIPCTASPNVTAGRTLYPKLVTAEWIEAQAQEWGRDSTVFRARVMGEFPTESETQLVPLAWVHAARERRASDGAGGLRLGVDVARYGADETVFALVDDEGVRELTALRGLSTMETAGRVMALARTHGLRGERVAVDDTGVGGGVTDRLCELGLRVTAVQLGGRATARGFANRRAELFWALREALNPQGEARLGLPTCARLTEELSAMRYSFTSRGDIQVESKDALRTRLERSPDRADALALSFAARGEAGEVRVWEV